MNDDTTKGDLWKSVEQIWKQTHSTTFEPSKTSSAMTGETLNVATEKEITASPVSIFSDSSYRDLADSEVDVFTSKATGPCVLSRRNDLLHESFPEPKFRLFSRARSAEFLGNGNPGFDYLYPRSATISQHRRVYSSINIGQEFESNVQDVGAAPTNLTAYDALDGLSNATFNLNSCPSTTDNNPPIRANRISTRTNATIHGQSLSSKSSIPDSINVFNPIGNVSHAYSLSATIPNNRDDVSRFLARPRSVGASPISRSITPDSSSGRHFPTLVDSSFGFTPDSTTFPGVPDEVLVGPTKDDMVFFVQEESQLREIYTNADEPALTLWIELMLKLSQHPWGWTLYRRAIVCVLLAEIVYNIASSDAESAAEWRGARYCGWGLRAQSFVDRIRKQGVALGDETCVNLLEERIDAILPPLRDDDKMFLENLRGLKDADMSSYDYETIERRERPRECVN